VIDGPRHSDGRVRGDSGRLCVLGIALLIPRKLALDRVMKALMVAA
jgi:hypothetical protein